VRAIFEHVVKETQGQYAINESEYAHKLWVCFTNQTNEREVLGIFWKQRNPLKQGKQVYFAMAFSLSWCAAVK